MVTIQLIEFLLEVLTVALGCGWDFETALAFMVDTSNRILSGQYVGWQDDIGRVLEILTAAGSCPAPTG